MQILDQIAAILNSVWGSAATIAVVLEFIFRMIPTQKPLSILHVIGAVAKKLGEILIQLGDLLDKVLPQVKAE